MNCYIKTKNGNISQLFLELSKKYPVNKAIEMYVVATTPSMLKTYSRFDSNNEPLISDVEDNLIIDDNVILSKGNIKVVEDILKNMEDQIEKNEDSEDPYINKQSGLAATRVTKKVEEFVPPFNAEDWIKKTLEKYTGDDIDAERERLERQLKIFEKKAVLGTSFHKVLENLFKQNINSLDDLSITEIDEDGEEYSFIDFERVFKDRELLQELKDNKAAKNTLQKLINLKAQINNSIPKGAKVYSEVLVYDKETNIAGTIDLLVINPDGTVFIYDYKFSGKGISDWNNYKFESIKYQQAFYKTILNKYGIKVSKSSIISVEMDINSDGEIANIKAPSFSNITSKISSQSQIGTNIKKVLKSDFNDDLLVTVSSKRIHNILGVLFDYHKNGFDEIEINENRINHFWNKHRDGFYNHFSKSWVSFNDAKGGIKGEDKQKEAIRNYFIELEQRKNDLSNNLADFILNSRLARENRTGRKIEEVTWGFGSTRKDLSIRSNIEPIVNKYIRSVYTDSNGNEQYEWEIIRNDDLTALGMVMFKSNITNTVDIVSITNEKLDSKFKLASGNTILGNLLSKYQEQKYSLPNNTIAEAELLKAFLYLIDSEVEYKVGDIVVLSEESTPRRENAKTLLETIREIKRTKALDSNEAFKAIYSKINNQNLNYTYLENYKNYIQAILFSKRPYISDKNIEYFEYFLEEVKNHEELRKILVERQGYLNDIIEYKKLKNVSTFYDEQELRLVQQVLLELKEYDPRDHVDIDKMGWFLLTKNRLATDPKDFEEKSIKPVVDLYTKAVDAISKRFLKYKKGIYKDFNDLINANLGIVSANLGGYTINAYDNLYEYMPNSQGELVKTMRLRDPDNDIHIAPHQTPLSDIEKSFIRKYIATMDNIRKEKLSAYQYEQFHSDPSRIREIQLVPASLTSALKSKFTKEVSINGVIKNIFAVGEAVRHVAKHMLNVDLAFEDDVNYWSKRETKKEMVDSFIWLETDPDKREEKLAQGSDMFEQNLELILDLYALNNYKAQEINKILPDVNAIISLVSLNKHAFFTSLDPKVKSQIETFLEKYRDEVIFGSEATAKDEKEMKGFSKVLTGITTTLTLGFKPAIGAVSFLTNLFSTTTSTYNGLVSDRFKGGYESFTGLRIRERLGLIGVDNYRKGMQFVGMTPSNLWSNENIVNELAFVYRVANAETFRLKEVMSLDNRGIKAFFSRWAHWMNSAPDYMHRMGMFAGEMLAEGTLKVDSVGNVRSDSAHQYINGKLVYNEKLDDRFSELFAEVPDKSSIKYKEQAALYNMLKTKLASEPYGLNEDGTLARAYTQEQIEDKVRVANMIYGDYTPENRSELERMAFGSLFMQFSRWKKAKKNMWYKDYTKLGTKYVPYLYKDNEVIHNEDYEKLTEEEKLAYVQQGWQIGQYPTGRMHEGIIQTLIYMYDHVKKEGLVKGAKSIYNMEDFRKRNINQMFSDIILFLLLAALGGAITNEVAAKILSKSSEDLFALNLVGLNPYAPYKGTGLPFASASLFERFFFDVFDNIATPEDMPMDLLDNIGFIQQITDFRN